MPDSFRGFLERSLEAIREEHPPAHARLCATMAERRVTLKVDGPPFALCFEARAIRFSDEVEGSDVTARLDRGTVLGLIDGEVTLRDALLDGSFALRGSVEQLLAFQDAFQTYVHGAVRAPGTPALLAEFREPSAIYDQRGPYPPSGPGRRPS